MIHRPSGQVLLRAALFAACAMTGAACGGTTNPNGSPSSAAPTNPVDQGATPGSGSPAVAYADCTRAGFGPPLAPLNPPATVHVYPNVPPMSVNITRLYRMTITTAKGQIVLCLQPQLAPATVNTVVTLARNHFYDGLAFNRVVPNFVLQGGDPTGTGTGGPGFEFNDEPVLNSYVLGAVAMANQGANTNGSQFFICIGTPSSSGAPGTASASVRPQSSAPPATPGTSARPQSSASAAPVAECPGLSPTYNLFGKVESGLDVADQIREGTLMTSVVVSEQQ